MCPPPIPATVTRGLGTVVWRMCPSVWLGNRALLLTFLQDQKKGGDVPKEELKCVQQPPKIAITACNTDSIAKTVFKLFTGFRYWGVKHRAMLLSNSRLLVQVSFPVIGVFKVPNF